MRKEKGRGNSGGIIKKEILYKESLFLCVLDYLLTFPNNLSISIYNHTRVIRSPKLAYHSMNFGAFALTHLSMRSKSSARLKAAIPTMNILIPIPIAPLS